MIITLTSNRVHHRPGQLYLIAAIDLRRRAAIVIGTPAKLQNRRQEQAGDDEKDRTAHCENEQRQLLNRISRC